MRVYYDRDADVNLIKGKKVAIVGFDANWNGIGKYLLCYFPKQKKVGGVL